MSRGYMNTYATPKKRRVRRDVCGHPDIVREACPVGLLCRCVACGHSWLEVPEP